MAQGEYYYMRLKENFFDSEAIVILESLPDGYLYSNILLKMYLKSLRDNGRLMFRGIIPYSAEMLSTITRHSIGVVEKAIDIFEKLGLIEKLDTGAMYMTDIQNFVGQSSDEADRKKEYRQRIECEKITAQTNDRTNVQTNVQTNNGQCPQILEKEKEIDTETEKEKEKGVALLPPPPDLEPKKKKVSLVIPTIYSLSPDLTEALYRYVEHRKAIKSPMTQNAFDLSIKELFKMAKTDDDMIEIINQSIMNGWKGLFPLKDHGTVKNAPSKPIPTPDEYRSKTTW